MGCPGEKFTSKQIVQLIYGICTYRMNSRLANIRGLEIGDDEDFGTFFLGRKPGARGERE